jgi:hypothetical protein
MSNRLPAAQEGALELNAIFENATVGILFTHNRKLMQANRCARKCSATRWTSSSASRR